MSADVFETEAAAPDEPAEELVAAPAESGPKPEAAAVVEPVKPPVAVAPETVVRATLDVLLSKSRRKDEFTVDLPQQDGETTAVSFVALAISGPDYDKLVAKCPPTREQAARGNAYDPDDFEPLLMAECVTEPKLTKQDWAKVRKHPDWSGGEWASLFMRVQSLCLAGLNVPFS